MAEDPKRIPTEEEIQELLRKLDEPDPPRVYTAEEKAQFRARAAKLADETHENWLCWLRENHDELRRKGEIAAFLADEDKPPPDLAN